MNKYFELYQAGCHTLDNLSGGMIASAKKLRGALAAELLRQMCNQYFEENGISVKASPVNVYINGSKYEYDVLFVKSSAEPFYNLAYQPEDVVAVIESKAGGLFNVEGETTNIAKAVNRAWELNNDIRFGYITMSENVPKHSTNALGYPTVHHWELTQRFLAEKVYAEHVIYAVTLHQGKNLCDKGSDEEFYKFIDALVR